MVNLAAAIRAAFWPDGSECSKAGYGPLSDGTPRSTGRAGESEREMPDPPRGSRYCGHNISEDDTQRVRRAR